SRGPGRGRARRRRAGRRRAWWQEAWNAWVSPVGDGAIGPPRDVAWRCRWAYPGDGCPGVRANAGVLDALSRWRSQSRALVQASGQAQQLAAVAEHAAATVRARHLVAAGERGERRQHGDALAQPEQRVATGRRQAQYGVDMAADHVRDGGGRWRVVEREGSVDNAVGEPLHARRLRIESMIVVAGHDRHRHRGMRIAER